MSPFDPLAPWPAACRGFPWCMSLDDRSSRQPAPPSGGSASQLQPPLPGTGPGRTDRWRSYFGHIGPSATALTSVAFAQLARDWQHFSIHTRTHFAEELQLRHAVGRRKIEVPADHPSCTPAGGRDRRFGRATPCQLSRITVACIEGQLSNPVVRPAMLPPDGEHSDRSIQIEWLPSAHRSGRDRALMP